MEGVDMRVEVTRIDSEDLLKKVGWSKFNTSYTVMHDNIFEVVHRPVLTVVYGGTMKEADLGRS